MEGQVLDAAAKALSINLDKTIYGAFAEIGAGQEIARNFFVVGGTIFSHSVFPSVIFSNTL